MATAKAAITAMLDSFDKATEPSPAPSRRTGSSYTGRNKQDTMELNRRIVKTDLDRRKVTLVDYFQAGRSS